MKIPGIDDLVRSEMESIWNDQKELEGLENNPGGYWHPDILNANITYLKVKIRESKELLEKYKLEVRDETLKQLLNK